ncbi:MAG: hypothetical protein V3T70_00095, partial [Phycisphaerae bacterium]
MSDRPSVRARAYTSIGNVGYGFDVFGMAVDVAFDDVELVRVGDRAGGNLEIVVTGPHAAEIPTEPQRNTAGLAVQSLLGAH